MTERCARRRLRLKIAAKDVEGRNPAEDAEGRNPAEDAKGKDRAIGAEKRDPAVEGAGNPNVGVSAGINEAGDSNDCIAAKLTRKNAL